MTLLFVEDEYYTRTGILESIRWAELGITTVESAADGKLGMERLRMQPDLLLVDIRMPYHTGLEIAAMAKQNDPDCEVIILSSYSDKEYLLTAISLSTVAYIEKPVDLDELTTALRQAVTRRERSLKLKGMSGRALVKQLVVDQEKCSQSTRIVLERITTQYADPDLSLEKLAELVHLNPTYLSGSFKSETGSSLKRMLIRIRVEEACELLRSTNMPIADVAVKVGYLSPSYFSKLFRKETGCSPNEYRDGKAAQFAGEEDGADEAGL